MASSEAQATSPEPSTSFGSRLLRSPALRAILIALAAVLVSMARRPNQINRPAVWVEEGTKFIPQYLEQGWAFLLEPVNGYLELPSKVLTLIACHVSFIHYPVASYILALVSAALVALAIFQAPTLIPYRPVAALVPFIIPFDPETVGIGLYVFWYVGLLSALGLFWREGEAKWTRAAFVAVGGLSAPLGISLTPFFLIRALWRRSLSNWLALAASAGSSLVQVYFIFRTHENNANFIGSLLLDPVKSAKLFITKFISEFFWASEPLLLIGVLALFCAAVWLWQDVRKGNYIALGLVACGLVSAILSIIRVPLDDINAMAAGPRYFLYPFIFFGWAMLAFAGAQPARRTGIAFAGALVLTNAATFIYRPHDALDWSGAARTCLSTPGSHDLPVHFTGNAAIAWKVTFTQDQCRRLQAIAIF